MGVRILALPAPKHENSCSQSGSNSIFYVNNAENDNIHGYR